MILKYQFYFTLKMFYASPCVILIAHILLNRLKDFKANAPVFESVNEKVSSTSSCSTEVRLICFYIVLQQFFFFKSHTKNLCIYVFKLHANGNARDVHYRAPFSPIIGKIFFNSLQS